MAGSGFPFGPFLNFYYKNHPKKGVPRTKKEIAADTVCAWLSHLLGVLSHLLGVPSFCCLVLKGSQEENQAF